MGRGGEADPLPSQPMKVILRSIAEEDVAAAVDWYEHQSPGLGDRFLFNVRESLERISSHPEAYPLVHPPRLRRILLSAFPYGLFYLIESDQAVVTACFHVRQHPRRWTSRA